MVNYGFLSTYPPTQCGLATFCAALLRHLSNPMAGSRCGVVQVVDGAYQTVRQEPAAATITVRPLSASRTAEVLNRYDVLILQHEYGIYSGLDGADVLDVLDRVQIPVITVLHTVLACPTPHQRLVLQRVIDASDAVVVLSQTAAAVLEADDPDLGADRARQGHRMGHRRAQPSARPATGCPVPGGRPDPSEGARRPRRGLSRQPAPPSAGRGRARPGRVRPDVPRSRIADEHGAPGGRRAAALRLQRPGDLRSAHRGG